MSVTKGTRRFLMWCCALNSSRRRSRILDTDLQTPSCPLKNDYTICIKRQTVSYLVAEILRPRCASLRMTNRRFAEVFRGRSLQHTIGQIKIGVKEKPLAVQGAKSLDSCFRRNDRLEIAALGRRKSHVKSLKKTMGRAWSV